MGGRGTADEGEINGLEILRRPYEPAIWKYIRVGSGCHSSQADLLFPKSASRRGDTCFRASLPDPSSPTTSRQPSPSRASIKARKDDLSIWHLQNMGSEGGGGVSQKAAKPYCIFFYHVIYDSWVYSIVLYLRIIYERVSSFKFCLS